MIVFSHFTCVATDFFGGIDLEKLLVELDAIKENDIRLKKPADRDEDSKNDENEEFADYDDDWD